MSLALSYPLAKAFSLGFDSVYSVEADGIFVELSVHYHWKNTDESFSIELYILQGYDFGYASHVHDGVNHLQCGVDASYSLTAAWRLSGYVAQSWAQTDIKRQDGDDELWAGMAVHYQFE